MKRLTILCTLLLSATLLVSCNSSSATDNAETETEGEEEQVEEKEDEAVTLKVTSDILGLADTGNKSTLKQTLINTGGPGDTALYYYNENGERVQYEDQDGEYELEPVTYQGSAVLELGTDSDKIDSSNAVVQLIDGNGYYAEELVLSERAQNLLQDAVWEDGKFTYTLTTGDLEWNTWDYYDTDYEKDFNSGREWSMMGGDGNGVYYFTLEVSGIKCNLTEYLTKRTF